jgi:hypothetical protein
LPYPPGSGELNLATLFKAGNSGSSGYALRQRRLKYGNPALKDRAKVRSPLRGDKAVQSMNGQRIRLLRQSPTVRLSRLMSSQVPQFTCRR